MTLKLFRRTKITCFITLMLSAMALALVLFPYSYVDKYGQAQIHYGILGEEKAVRLGYDFAVLAGFAILIFIMFFIIYLFNRSAKKKHAQLLAVLYDECKPKMFLNCYAPIIKELNKMRSIAEPNTANAFIAYAYGLYEVGEAEKAAEVFEKLANAKAIDKKHMVTIKCKANLALLEYYCDVQNAEEAEICNLSLEEMFEAFKGDFLKNYDRNLPVYKEKMIAVNHFYDKEYSNALDFFVAEVGQFSNNLELVHSHCHLAVIYSALGKSDLASHHLKETMRLGPRMHSVSKTEKIVAH